MKLNILIFLGMVLLGFGINYALRHHVPAAIPPQIHTNKPAADAAAGRMPDFSMTALDGRTRAISEFAGKTIVINFWATWCPPCVAEFPRLLELAEIGDERVVLLAVSSDHDRAALDRFLNRLGAADKKRLARDNVVIVTDPDSAITFDIFGSARLPETIIVDPDGRMIRKFIGADWQIADIMPYIAPAAATPATSR